MPLNRTPHGSRAASRAPWRGQDAETCKFLPVQPRIGAVPKLLRAAAPPPIEGECKIDPSRATVTRDVPGRSRKNTPTGAPSTGRRNQPPPAPTKPLTLLPFAVP